MSRNASNSQITKPLDRGTNTLTTVNCLEHHKNLKAKLNESTNSLLQLQTTSNYCHDKHLETYCINKHPQLDRGHDKTEYSNLEATGKQHHPQLLLHNCSIPNTTS